jgi:hypothetical protein
MACMWGMAAIAVFDRPATPGVVIAVLAVMAGWAFHVWSDRPIDPDHRALDDATDDHRPAPLPGQALETPAVIALLTNGYDVPPSAVTATVLDLAARGWVRLTVSDAELVVVTRGQGAAGDALRPYERHVLAHLA